MSPSRSEAHRPSDAELLFKHISCAFPPHQSVMQNLANAEQCHEHILQLLMQAQQPAFATQKRSQFVQYLCESCEQLMQKMDAVAGSSSR